MEGKEFGQVYLMHELACRCGLLKTLRNVYGDRRGRGLAAIAVTHSTDIMQHRYIMDELRRNASRELCGAPMDLGWGPGTTLNEAMASAASDISRVFSGLDVGKDSVVMELTSLGEGFTIVSGIAGFRESFRHGHTVYLGINGVYGTPFYYCFRESSENPFKSISRVFTDIRSMGPRSVHFVFGRPRTVEELAYAVNRGLTFTTMVPHRSWAASHLLSGISDWRTLPSMIVGGSVFSCRESETPLGEGHVRVMTICNENVRTSQTSILLGRIQEAVAAASGIRWGGSVQDRLSGLGYSDILDCLELSRGGNGFTLCSPRQALVEERMQPFRNVLLVTTSDLRPFDLCSVLIRQGRFEWELSEFRRNQLNAPEHLPTERTTEAMFFLDFMRMVLKAQLNIELNRSRNMDDTPDDVLNVLRGIRANLIDGTWKMDDLNDRQRRVLRSFGIRIPDDALAEAVMSPGARRIQPDLYP